MTALVGTNAQFHCAGTGNHLVWVVDGLQADHPDIIAHGVTLPSSSGTYSPTSLYMYQQHRRTMVRCAISVLVFSTPVVSNYSTLIVLPGE